MEGSEEERVEGRTRRVILVVPREGWDIRLVRTWVPSSPAPRTRIEVGGDGIFAVGGFFFEMEWLESSGWMMLIDLIAVDMILLEWRLDVWLNEIEFLNGSVS